MRSIRSWSSVVEAAPAAQADEIKEAVKNVISIVKRIKSAVKKGGQSGGMLEQDDIITATVKHDKGTRLKGALSKGPGMESQAGGALFKNALKMNRPIKYEPKGGVFGDKIRRTRRLTGRRRLP